MTEEYLISQLTKIGFILLVPAVICLLFVVLQCVYDPPKKLKQRLLEIPKEEQKAQAIAEPPKPTPKQRVLLHIVPEPVQKELDVLLKPMEKEPVPGWSASNAK